ncbi:nucleotidyltransferase family protein [Sphingobacterium corticibacterium]|uniref:Nucleotidyltransferase family protein n=1 Tax=Sphingobacterium corticibacterium TaxID=2484746 RepID=A0A4Q6XI74_9SPHI|nr:nucleotidyltransferase family protein [Sphingobacterium corticibacterium]RZF58895.1 nucleotidyltransferase family protein [Sphingobacterium corticibacterium]
MKTLILAAGYATRLYPLTKHFPKPLLEVGGKTILDRLVEAVDGIEQVNQHIVVTNATFHQHFEDWKAASGYKKDIVILNDGTTSNDNRLGAVRDILFAIEQLGINEDLLVLAGDNVVTFSFANFVRYAREKRTSCISCHEEPSLAALQKTGVLEADENMRAIAMHEKPENPPSHWAVPPFYYYKKEDLPLIQQAIDQGCGYDAPGNLAAWLCRKTEVYAWPINGERYDIGDMAAYEHAQEVFKEV